MVTAMQVQHSRRKGCVLFGVYIYSDKGEDVYDVEVLSRYLVLQQFRDVFPIDILKDFSPHREVDFFVELVPKSKEPYKMNKQNLVELNLQLKKMLDK